MFKTSTKTIKEQQDEITEALDQAYTTFVTYKVTRVVLKNIMLIGRSRTGKSTLQSILVNPRHVGNETTIYAETKRASFQSYVVEGSISAEDVYKEEANVTAKESKSTNKEANVTAKESKSTNKEANVTAKESKSTNKEANVTAKDSEGINKEANVTTKESKNTNKEAATGEMEQNSTGVTVLNIIDTPGLFEHAAVDMDIQDNQTILDTIQMCINREITKLHLVCFCASFESGINDQDMESLEMLIHFLGKDISKNSCLIITRCESKNEEQRERLRNELLNDSHFKRIAHYFNRGIYFSGVLNRDNWNKAQRETIQDQFETICGYRQELIDLFSSTVEPFEIKNCDFDYMKKALDERQNLLTQIRSLRQKGKLDEKLIQKLQSEACAIS